MEEKEIISLITNYAEQNHKTPTIISFSKDYNFHPSSIIRKFGSWNVLLRKANLKTNISDKKSDEQILYWLKIHPNARYNEIPPTIRNRLQNKYNSISEARKAAGLLITDWRKSTKRRKNSKTSNGRPIEFTEDFIIENLRNFAIKLGRPPKLKEINKKSCGIPISAIFARFGNLNCALQKAALPTIYSPQEYNRLLKQFEILIMNVKLELNDLPISYNIEVNGLKPTFIYSNKCEKVLLNRSDIIVNLDLLNSYKEKFKNVSVCFLVDDSLNDIQNIESYCILNVVDKLSQTLLNKIFQLRKSYDDLSRKYVGQPIING